jgi:hypothetical protein
MIDNNDRIKNGLAIALAACVAIFIMQGDGILFYAGIVGICFLLLIAVISPWLGLLALYPLAFMLRPAPPSIGLPEFSFVALLAVIFVGAVVRFLRFSNIRSVGRFYSYPLLIGLAVLSINLVVAVKNGVPLVDWIRGVIPFLFLYTLLPISVLVGDNENKIHWLGGAVATLIFLIAGYVVFYYFYHDMWRPYWLATVDGETVKISKEAAVGNLDAAGPMRDRITMLLAQATDVFLPVGLVAGVVICTLARTRSVTAVGVLMSVVCMFAVLITFTRSMLLSAFLVIFIFSVFVIVYRKTLRIKLLATVSAMSVLGFVFIFATGMQEIWFGRMSLLVESGVATVSEVVGPKLGIEHFTLSEDGGASTPVKVPTDFNVSSRFDEYRIAWKMFLSHPLLGNGLGVKHEMRWETSEGISFTQFVAYVHNWPLYTLMVGGALGLLIYSLILSGPALFRVRSIRAESAHWTLIRVTILTMVVYGLFFAVFRLITFNLLLAALWGVVFSQMLDRHQKSWASVDDDDSEHPSYRLKNVTSGPEPVNQESMGSSV